MTSTTTDETDTGRGHPAHVPVPEFVDWLVAAVIALGGSIAIVGASALLFVVDRDLLAESIEEGTVTVTVFATELTDAEAVEVALSVVSWVGVGLLVTGVGMVLFAIGYVVRRHRAHSRARAGESVNSFGAFAVLGAVVTVVFSFVPISPAVGGAVAGYLERGESTRTVSVGAVSGALAALPLLVILVFVLGGVASGLLTVDLSGMAVVTGAALLFTAMLLVTIGAGLGALGGYVGGAFAEGRTESR